MFFLQLLVSALWAGKDETGVLTYTKVPQPSLYPSSAEGSGFQSPVLEDPPGKLCASLQQPGTPQDPAGSDRGDRTGTQPCSPNSHTARSSTLRCAEPCPGSTPVTLLHTQHCSEKAAAQRGQVFDVTIFPNICQML